MKEPTHTPNPTSSQGPRTGWAWLLLAAVFEIVFALSTKASDGFTKPIASAVTVVATVVGAYLLSRALRTIDVSVGYTVWVGLGATGTVFIGHWLFSEPLTPGRLISIGVIMAGVVALQLSDSGK